MFMLTEPGLCFSVSGLRDSLPSQETWSKPGFGRAFLAWLLPLVLGRVKTR